MCTFVSQFMFFLPNVDICMADNSFQSEEPHYHTRFREIKNPSMEYSSSAPIRMPMGKNSPPDDDAEVRKLCFHNMFLPSHKKVIEYCMT